ncbi:LLM class flavin-dependent oxidoreductase [Kineococcus sp. SYSU DK001]|uniref:LLM class flavin-dependent oxidoreductase n=1 Tax=Kineococcus sp. SYSU DK001 TaxID=3383122 RepID=UPI003D7CD1BB
MSVPLSVLDLSPVTTGSPASTALRRTVDLARAVEGLGYHRYWVAEHHGSPAVVSAPAVLIASIAAVTTTLRVGAGGIMLPLHSPLQVAETFRALEALHPGRIDLGLGRAAGADGRTARALVRTPGREFGEQLADLHGHVAGFAPGHPLAGIAATPTDVPLPPVWLLGSSDHGAQLAAALGTGFAYAGHFGALDPADVLGRYRQGFTPSPRPGLGRSAPHAVLTVAVVVAERAERAAELAHAARLAAVRSRLGAPAPLPTPEEAAAHRWTLAERNTAGRLPPLVSGTAGEVVPRLAGLVERTGADELMVVTDVHDPAERVRSHELLARAWADRGAASAGGPNG